MMNPLSTSTACSVLLLSGKKNCTVFPYPLHMYTHNSERYHTHNQVNAEHYEASMSKVIGGMWQLCFHAHAVEPRACTTRESPCDLCLMVIPARDACGYVRPRDP